MFQLIVAIVSIALVVILAALAMWVGGDAFTQSGEKATFATYLNQGSQIEAGLKMYQADHGTMPSGFGTSDEVIDELQDKQYLRSRPPGQWEIVGDTIYRALEKPEECKRLNLFMGKDVDSALAAAHNGCPPCAPTDPAEIAEFKTWPGCTRETTP